MYEIWRLDFQGKPHQNPSQNYNTIVSICPPLEVYEEKKGADSRDIMEGAISYF